MSNSCSSRYEGWFLQKFFESRSDICANSSCKIFRCTICSHYRNSDTEQCPGKFSTKIQVYIIASWNEKSQKDLLLVGLSARKTPQLNRDHVTAQETPYSCAHPIHWKLRKTLTACSISTKANCKVLVPSSWCCSVRQYTTKKIELINRKPQKLDGT